MLREDVTPSEGESQSEGGGMAAWACGSPATGCGGRRRFRGRPAAVNRAPPTIF